MGRGLLIIGVMGVAGCEACDPDVLNPIDGGVVDAGLGGEGEGGEGEGEGEGEACFFSEVPGLPYEPDGSEDFVDALGDAQFPDVDLLATWSRVVGDDFVVEFIFAAPPFRVAGHQAQIHLGFAGDVPATGSCGMRSSRAPEDFAPSSDVVGLGEGAPQFGWPPDFFAFPCGRAEPLFIDACEHIFVTPTGAFVRAVIPIEHLLAADLTPLRYRAALEYGVQADSILEHNWTNLDDVISSRGGSAATDEQFVSVCDLTCPANAQQSP